MRVAKAHAGASTAKAGGSAAKSDDGAKRVDEYLGDVPEPARTTLNKLREVIRKIVPA